MLSKKSYGQVVKGLERIRKHHDEDRKENPGLAPCSYKSQILRMIEATLRANHERYTDSLGEETVKYLAKQGLIVPYLGNDYTFPSSEPLPSREEVIKQTHAALESIDHERRRYDREQQRLMGNDTEGW